MDGLKSWLNTAPSRRPPLEATEFARDSLSKPEASAALGLIAAARLRELQSDRAPEMDAQCISHGDLQMRFAVQRFGDAEPGARSLYISMHGGGGCPAHVNDSQWVNQQSLYAPSEGFYVAPRAPTDTWDLWHQAHIDLLFGRLIDDFVALRGVDANRVYVLGYSAGGDGAYRLAPRMADRWAGAAIMAGHPGEARPDSLNNTPCFVQCGARDGAYERNARAREWGADLQALAERHPGEYPHECVVYPQFGHWMNGECRRALPWMARSVRDPWPRRVVAVQGNVTHARFFWIASDGPRTGDRVTAQVAGQVVTVESSDVRRVRLRLSDRLVDLDQPVTVRTGSGSVAFKGMVRRSVAPLVESMNERFDVSSAACAYLEVDIGVDSVVANECPV